MIKDLIRAVFVEGSNEGILNERKEGFLEIGKVKIIKPNFFDSVCD